MTTSTLTTLAPGPVPITIDIERDPSLRGPALAGLVTIAVAFGGFLLWACVAHLDHAATAPGLLIVDSHRKTVQHLEGGILRELLVREGERVSAGQTLLRIDGTQVQAQLALLETQQWAARVREARLHAEEQGAVQWQPAEELVTAAGSPERAAILNTEQRLFKARSDGYHGTIALLRQRITQTEPLIAALGKQNAAVVKQVGYLEDELAGALQLFQNGNERRTRVLDLQRRISELAASLADIDGRTAQARQLIAATELDIVQQQNTRSNDVFTQLQQAQGQIGDLTDKVRAARDVFRRTEVVAPQDGQVTNIRFYTLGGVIGAGQPILDIVPLDDELIVEAQINPQDIESVHTGLAASTRLTAYSQRVVPPIDGEVSYVAADLQNDARTGLGFYTVRVRLSARSLAEVPRVQLYPGMPAEVLIITARRQALDYFLAPLVNSLARAGHER